MRRLNSIFLFLFVLLSNYGNGQISVNVTGNTNTTPNLATSYTSLSAVLADLNAVTAMSGAVVLTCTGGTSETAPATGFTLGSPSLNPVLSATNSITINTDGGVVTLNAGVGTATPGSAAPDGIFKLIGADYVTINGLTFTDGNAANPATMEFGLAFFKFGAGDGCNNNLVRNCIFNMQRVNNASGSGPMFEGSVGILVINSTATAATTTLTPTNGGTLATNGTNSGNRFWRNTINGGNYGIGISGFAASTGVGPTPVATTFLGDLGNDIGSAQGNTILNFGGGGTTSPSAGIRVTNQWSINISNNVVNNNDGGGVNHATTLRGIYAQSGTSANATINSNTVTIKGGGTTSQVSALESGIGATPLSNTININNNIVSGEYLTATTGAFFGIYSISATPSTLNIQNNSVNGFTYSASSLTGTGTVYPIYTTGSNALTTINATGNTVNNITRVGTTGGNTIGIFLSAGIAGMTVNANNNVVSNISINGTGTAGLIYGIQTSTGIVTVNSNTIENLNNLKSTGTAVVYGLYNFGLGGTENFNNNIIRNLTNNGTGAVAGVHFDTGAGTRTISGNTIHTLTGAGTIVNGINSLLSTPSIFNNKIYNLQSTTNGSPVVSGVILASVNSGSANISNNIIGDLKAPNASSSGPTSPTLRGINLTSVTTSSNIIVSFNTVYLNGATSGTSFATAALFHTTSTTATTAQLTLRNNILINVSTPVGSGLTVAYQRSSTTLTNYNNASNNNIFFGGIPGASNLIYYDGTNANQTLATFKALVTPREANSVTESTPFLSITGSSPDFLHINPAVPTQAESGAITIAGITTDFDGNTRNATTPDIGADEGNFTLADLTPPSISYLPLLVTCATGNRALNGVVITDVTGVNTGATRPRVYYNKNNGPWFSQPGTLVSGTALNGTWDFTIVAADMGGLLQGDLVYYYVIAEDIISPANVGAVPGTGLVATSTLSVTTHPSNPHNFLIGNSIGGTYTVGSGGAYPTLTAAVNAYNTSCMSAPVIFELTDALYSGSETFPIIINQNPDASSVNTLTIRPATGVTAEISGSVASNAVISIRGRFIIIDGSNNNSASRDLTISNTSTTSPNIITILSTGTNPVINNRVENCILINGVNSSSGVIVRGVDGLAGYFNDIAFENNSFRRSFYGVFINAFVTGTNGSGLLITGNDMNSVGADALRLAGIYVQGVNGATISNNNIGNITNSNAENPRGIWLATGTNNAVVSGNQIQNISLTNTGANASSGIVISTGATTTNIVVNNNTISNLSNSGSLLNFAGILCFAPNTDITNNTISGMTQNAAFAFWGLVSSGALDCDISGNTITGLTTGTTGINSALNIQGASSNVNVFNNVIRNISNTNSTGSGSNGIQLSTTTTNANISVYNNMVSDVRSYGFAGGGAGNNGYGMIVTSGSGYKIYYNTVALNTNQTVAGWPAAFNVTSGVTEAGAIDLRNNIFSNSQSVGTERYAIYSGAPSTVFSNINYNDYFTTGANLGFIGSNRPTLADIQTGFGGNTNSINLQPIFVSPTDLHLDPASSTSLNNLGTPISGFTTDFEGNTRDVTTPDMGADEFTPPPCAVADGGTAMAADDGPFCTSGSTVISASGFSGGTGTNYLWQSSSDLAFTTPVDIGTPSPSYADLSTGTLTSTTYYRLKVTCSNDMTEDFSSVSNPVEITNPPILTTTGATRCGTGTVDLMATANPGDIIRWYTASSGGSSLGSGTTFQTPVISTTTTYHAGATTPIPGVLVTQGAGATTSATYSNPFYSLWSNIHTQHLITAAELTASGLLPGAINSVALNITNAGTLPMIDLSVKIGHTTSTNLTAFVNNAGFSTVFTSASLLPTTGVNTLTFSAPFNWDGTSNLILEFCHGNGASSATMSRTCLADNTSYNSSIKSHISAATNAATICADVSTNLLTYTVRPQFIFNGVGGCEGTRSPVTATVDTPPALTLSAPSTNICQGTPSSTVNITSNINDYDTYTWSPMSGVSGTPGSGYTFNPSTSTNYILTAGQTGGSMCMNTVTHNVTVNPVPTSTTATATPAEVCSGGNSQLNVSVNGLPGTIKISEVTLFRTGTGQTVTYPPYATGADLVEITNTTSSSVDVSGWTLEDFASNASTPTHSGFSFPSGTIIPANSFAVVCLGSGTDDIANRYFNTGGANDSWSSGGLVGIVLKNGSTIIDAVGLNSGYTFNPATGVTASDWTGFAPSGSGIAGTIRSAGNDTNSGADWIQSSAGTPQTIGTYNSGYTPGSFISTYDWSPATFLSATNVPNPMATGVTATTTYTVNVTTNGGCTVTSNSVTVTVVAGAAITTHPIAQSKCVGSTVMFNVGATGPGLSYQWRKDGIDLVNGGTISGATSATLTIAGLISGDAGNYDVVVTASCGASVTSNQAALAVETVIPTATISPVSPSYCAGGSVVLTASGAGMGGNYVWSPGTGLSGTNTAIVTANPLITTTYTVTVTNAGGCSDTEVVTVTVNPLPTILSATATPATLNCGDNSQLDVSVASVIGEYLFTNSTSTFSLLSGATPVVPSNSSNDDGISATLNIGFPFNFNGTSFSQFRMNTNGWMTFDVTATSTTNYASLNGTVNNIIAAYSGDLTSTGNAMSFQTSGSPGSQICKIQWTNTTEFTSTQVPDLASFQIWLYEGTNVIEIRYGSFGVGTRTGAQDPLPQVGLRGTSTGLTQILSVGSVSNWASPISGNVSTTTMPATVSVLPDNGRMYTFSPRTYSYTWNPATYLNNPAIRNPMAVNIGGSITYTVVVTDVATGCSRTSDNVVITANNCAIALNTKVFLSNVSGGTMDDYLRTLAGEFPLTDPYSAAPYSNSGLFTYVPAQTPATTTQMILDNNNVVDWVFVELRTGTSGSTTVTASKSGLLKNDGIIINPDGTPFSFSGVAAGNYFIAIKHRNHCGFMTNGTFVVPNPSLLNLTDNSVTLYQSLQNPLQQKPSGEWAMWSGDAVISGFVNNGDVNAVRSMSGQTNLYTSRDLNLSGSVTNADVNIVRGNSGQRQWRIE